MRLLLVLLVAFALHGCSFITTAAGSLIGNLGADFVEDQLKKNAIEKIPEKEQRKTEI